MRKGYLILEITEDKLTTPSLITEAVFLHNKYIIHYQSLTEVTVSQLFYC